MSAPATSTPTPPVAPIIPCPVKMHPHLWGKLQVLTLLAYGLILLVPYECGFWNLKFLQLGTSYLDVGSLAAVSVVSHFVGSLFNGQVGAEELGGAYCYDRALAKGESGLHFAPIGLVQMVRESRKVQDMQSPELKMTTKAPDVGATALLEKQLTLSLQGITQFVIRDIFEFRANFGTIDQAKRELNEIFEPTLAEDISTRTPAKIVEELPAINARLKMEMIQRTSDWGGIDVISSRLLSPALPPDLVTQMTRIAEASAKKQTTVIDADAKKYQLTEEGRGVAAAEQSMLDARAVGQENIMKKLKVSGETVIAAEVARDFGGKAQVLIVGAEGGMRDVMGIVKGASAALTKLETKTVEGGVS